MINEKMDNISNYSYHILYEGYAKLQSNSTEMKANCTCTLLKGNKNVIVDTMSPWDGSKIVRGLAEHSLNVDDIDYVVCTHGHSDHIGNNNLFLKAKHIVGFTFSYEDTYYLHPFSKGEDLIIDEWVRVMPTPGHTMSDVTVLVDTQSDGLVAITGDLFECKEDIEKPEIWLEAGSELPHQQRINRAKIADCANWIVPGHGGKFQTSPTIRTTLRNQIKDADLYL